MKCWPFLALRNLPLLCAALLSLSSCSAKKSSTHLSSTAVPINICVIEPAVKIIDSIFSDETGDCSKDKGGCHFYVGVQKDKTNVSTSDDEGGETKVKVETSSLFYVVKQMSTGKTVAIGCRGSDCSEEKPKEPKSDEPKEPKSSDENSGDKPEKPNDTQGNEPGEKEDGNSTDEGSSDNNSGTEPNGGENEGSAGGSDSNHSPDDPDPVPSEGGSEPEEGDGGNWECGPRTNCVPTEENLAKLPGFEFNKADFPCMKAECQQGYGYTDSHGEMRKTIVLPMTQAGQIDCNDPRVSCIPKNLLDGSGALIDKHKNECMGVIDFGKMTGNQDSDLETIACAAGDGKKCGKKKPTDPSVECDGDIKIGDMCKAQFCDINTDDIRCAVRLCEKNPHDLRCQSEAAVICDKNPGDTVCSVEACKENINSNLCKNAIYTFCSQNPETTDCLVRFPKELPIPVNLPKSPFCKKNPLADGCGGSSEPVEGPMPGSSGIDPFHPPKDPVEGPMPKEPSLGFPKPKICESMPNLPECI